jgi:nicotinamidase-related amidase
MQKDFIDGTLGTKEAESIVNAVVKRIENSQNELILFTQDTHGEDYLSTPEGKKLPVKHCIKGTEGWKINENILNAWRGNKTTIISPDLTDNTFEKPVFGSTKLVEYLTSRASEICEIEILGLCTDICVISNALMIKNFLPDINIGVNEKCCAGVTPQSHTEALNVMKMCQINIMVA